MTMLDPQQLIETARERARLFRGQMTVEHSPPLPVNDRDVMDETMVCSPDVAFIQNCGYLAYHDSCAGHSAWPIPDGLSSHELALFGTASGVVHRTPREGDIFLMYSTRRRQFVHTGVILDVVRHDTIERTEYYDIISAEGNTDHRGLVERGRTMKIERRVTPALGDRFLRWTDLVAVSGEQENAA